MPVTPSDRTGMTMKLAPGEMHKVLVNASAMWNDTSVDIEEGERYALSANGRWIDWYIPSSPEGFDSFMPLGSLVEQFRRHPHAPWFALIGAVGQTPDNQFIIGKGTALQVQTAGRLYVFANDVPGFYWNNHGHVELTIRRDA